MHAISLVSHRNALFWRRHWHLANSIHFKLTLYWGCHWHLEFEFDFPFSLRLCSAAYASPVQWIHLGFDEHRMDLIVDGHWHNWWWPRCSACAAHPSACDVHPLTSKRQRRRKRVTTSLVLLLYCCFAPVTATVAIPPPGREGGGKHRHP